MSRRNSYELSSGKGPSMWRTLEDKNTDPEEQKRLAEEEKPGGFVTDLLSPKTLVSRRSFVQGSSIAALAAGLQGCIRRPENEILPYSKAPEYLVPGIATHFATVTARGRDALGVLVTSNDGRPTKVEGNEQHIRSLGSTDVRGQLYVWDLYDPDRSKGPARRQGNALVDATAAELDKALVSLRKQHEADQGAGLRVLSSITNSPSLRRLRDRVAEIFPKAKVYTYSAVDDDNIRAGSRLAFGTTFYPVYEDTAASIIVSFGSDFLGTEMGAVGAGRRFVYRRGITSPEAEMSRLYVLEPNLSITGSMADHRWRTPQRDIGRYMRAVAADLAGLGISGLKDFSDPGDVTGIDPVKVRAISAELAGHLGGSLIRVGAAQPPEIHALGHAMNEALGNRDKTYSHGPSIEHFQDVGSRASIAALANEIGDAKTLVILGGNPAYDAPGDVGFSDLLRRKDLTSLHLATHRNETSGLCSWHVPMAHELESWGDQESLDGTVAVQQPLIAPLYGGRTATELLATLLGEKTTSAYEILRETHYDNIQKTIGALVLYGVAPDSLSQDGVWRSGLHNGVLVGPQAKTRPVNAKNIADAMKETPTYEGTLGPDNFEVTFEPDSALWDGQHANNLWALELPHPITKIVWDNPAQISPATSRALGVKNGQMLRLTKSGASVEVPAWIVPGQADFCITLSLGWGRPAAGRYGNGKGFDVNPLRMSDGMDFADGVKVEVLREKYNLVQTQTHDRMEGRPIAIDATLDEYKAEPDFASYRSVDPVSTPPLWKQQDYSEGHKWGMVIDLNGCTGCNACVVACQAENNIPAVGKFEVERGREMHWLRIDRYFVGDDENDPEIAVQPVTCQQCEEAPCENVCPVNATVHSPEGLNDMAYNRCVGTRYCANNCPYKVRRFNYLDWHGHLDDKFAWFKDFPESRKLQFNPNVTVRMRGVMEKCTYCVQRIQQGKIAAKREGRQMKDGDIQSACQQACPTRAIAFGDLNDPDSTVAKWSKINRNYKLLAEIGTRPRTSFLARIRNPNPKLKGNG